MKNIELQSEHDLEKVVKQTSDPLGNTGHPQLTIGRVKAGETGSIHCTSIVRLVDDVQWCFRVRGYNAG